LENKDFRLIGLPFYNEGQTNPRLRKEFEDVFNRQFFENKKES